MTTKEKIEMLCNSRGIGISKLERELTFSHGSLSKMKGISAERLNKVARYFGVSLTSLLDSDEIEWNPYTQELAIIDKEIEFVVKQMRENMDARAHIIEYARKYDEFLRMKGELNDLGDISAKK